MKRGLLLASAASFLGATVLAGARAADLPARQAAPIEYVRICDAYGAGFFYIPGTDTCFRAGGLALAELRGFDPSFSIVGPFFFGTGTPHPASGFVPSPTFGFAVQGGVQLNADYLSPGDKLWLQAAYEKGAFGYIAGSNYAFSYGSVSQNRFPGSGGTPLDYGGGWNPQINSDCVFTGSGSCEQQWGWDITGAYKHYWLPILSSAIYGSYLEVHYSANALAGFGGAVGVANLKEARIGTNLVWPPLKSFDIGAEFMYVHLNETRPVGLASDKTLTANGLPAFPPNNNQYEGRLRLQRAF
jgi:Porin subfamily